MRAACQSVWKGCGHSFAWPTRAAFQRSAWAVGEVVSTIFRSPAKRDSISFIRRERYGGEASSSAVTRRGSIALTPYGCEASISR